MCLTSSLEIGGDGMTDTTKVAVDALQERARELIEERDEVRRRLLEDAYRDALIERDLAGCIAGARALEHEIDVSGGAVIPPAKNQFLNMFVAGRNQMSSAYPQLKAEFGIQDDTADTSSADDSRPEMPRIADVILERLKVAGNEGSKAAEIRRYILRTYASDIHEKTVGMTLNRMQTAGQVRRDGRLWYLAQATKDAATSK